MDADSYLLELIRYIHLNPIRADIANDPADYAWSSHRSYIGMETLPWLETDWVLSQFAKRLKTCRQCYIDFVQAGKVDGHREEVHCGGVDGRVLGDDGFLRSVTKKPVQPSLEIMLTDIVSYVAAEYRVSEGELKSPTRNRKMSEARAVVGWLARNLGVASTNEVAFHFQRAASTLSRRIGKIDMEAKSSKRLQDKLDRCVNTIMQA